MIVSSATNAPSDAALGAAPTESLSTFNSSLTLNPATGFPTTALAAIQGDNGIIFDSLTEGNGTLTIGGTAGLGAQTFTTSRPIGVDSEAATINVNGYIVSLGGPLVSLGTNGIALGNATGESDLTIDDLSAGNNGKLILQHAESVFLWQHNHRQYRRADRRSDERRRARRDDGERDDTARGFRRARPSGSQQRHVPGRR